MRHRLVKPEDILVPETRVTSAFTEEIYQMFQQSVRDAGIQEPILCVEVDGKLYLVDGKNRLVEAKANKLPRVDVMVSTGTEADVYLKNLFINRMRGKTKASELVQVIKTLTDEYHLNSEDIAAKTGMSRDYTEKLMIIGQALPEVQAALDEERIGVGQAFELARIRNLDVQGRILYQLLLYQWSVADLRQHIANVQAVLQQQPAAEPAAEPPEPPKVTCRFCHQEYNLADVANPSICVSCSGVLYDTLAALRAQSSKDESP